MQAVRLSDTVTLLIDGTRCPPLDRPCATPQHRCWTCSPTKERTLNECSVVTPVARRTRATGPDRQAGCGELTRPDGRALPLKGLTVDTVIVGMTASSTVRQRFVNDGDTAIEATYVFPLPARAGVTDFAADLAGRRVVGVLKERGEARADYEQALVSGQRAAIVEEDRPDVFSVRVGTSAPAKRRPSKCG